MTEGAQRVDEIEHRHTREMESQATTSWPALLGDNTHYDDIGYLLARLRAVEGERDVLRQIQLSWDQARAEHAIIAYQRGTLPEGDVKTLLDGLRQAASEQAQAEARLREALTRLERHHNMEDCGWRGGRDEACPVAAAAREALTPPAPEGTR